MSNKTIVIKIGQDEIIAQLVTETTEAMEVSKPRMLHVMDMGNGQAGASFVPPMLLANDSQPVWVSKSSISMKTMDVNSDYERRYLEAISGIKLATSLNG